MDYSDFRIEDLIMNESFQQYCLGTDDEATLFWTEWIEEHPSQKKEIDIAKDIYCLLNGNNSSETFKIDELKFRMLMQEKGIGTSISSLQLLDESFSLGATEKIEFETIDSVNKEKFNEKTETSVVYLPSIKKRSIWLRIAAAVIILIIGAGTYFLLNHPQKEHEIVKSTKENHQKDDIMPGGNHALLTLSNGNTIILDNAKNGNLGNQGNTQVMKLDSGTLAYYNNNKNDQEVVYNTISTPRGGQYEIKLPDGTHVWLNSASSLKFPTTFSGTKREVELSGEAYFEVVKNKQMPFEVLVGSTKVSVLGTHFNINAYNDEPSINTTLLEGSVKFTVGSIEKLLHPGQQSVFYTSSQTVKVYSVDVQEVIAWKNGFFEFDNTDLATIMRQLSRWYNVDIIYQTTNNKGLFGGGISKQLNLSEVLHLLETNGVKFKIEDRKVIVLHNNN